MNLWCSKSPNFIAFSHIVQRVQCCCKEDGTRQIPTQERRKQRTNTVANALSRQIVCSCLAKLLILDKFLPHKPYIAHSVCVTCFFSLTAINRIFRIGWIQITLRFVMLFIRVYFFRLVTLIPIRIVSYHMHPPLYTYVCKSVPFSSKCRFAF